MAMRHEPPGFVMREKACLSRYGASAAALRVPKVGLEHPPD